MPSSTIICKPDDNDNDNDNDEYYNLQGAVIYLLHFVHVWLLIGDFSMLYAQLICIVPVIVFVSFTLKTFVTTWSC